MDKLTDERLRELQENAETYTMVYSPAVLSAVSELTALRAEREKPTQSDEEAPNAGADPAQELWWSLTGRLNEDKPKINAAFASIRAEGSAERAKLEAALREALALTEWRTLPKGQGTMIIVNPSPLEVWRIETARLLAQPAESGAAAESELLNAVGLLFFDCLAVKAIPSDYARAAIALVRSGAKP